jgi:hypothetical protein
MKVGGAADSAQWWARHRWPYNRALLIAGVLAFMCYVAAFERRCLGVPEAEITLFTTFFQGVGYLIAMGVANVCFNLGRWTEALVSPAHPEQFRQRAYQLGLLFSVALPFSVPAMILLSGCGRSGTP